MKSVFLSVALFYLLYVPVVSQDLGAVRISIDIDSVALSIDGEIVAVDSYGNQLVAGAYFILEMPAGENLLVFSRAGYDPIERLISIGVGDVISLEIKFGLGSDQGATTRVTVNDTVSLLSDPDSADIFVNSVEYGSVTPAAIITSGEPLLIEMYREGYEPLSHRLEVSITQPAALNFRLNSLPPETVTAEKLGLELLSIRKPRDPQESERIRTRFITLAETFAIIPLSQGIMARLIMGDDNKKEANLLIGVGVLLSGGSYILGKLLSKRRQREVEEFNELVTRDNQVSAVHNREIERSVKAANSDALKAWEAENRNRGIVEELAE